MNARDAGTLLRMKPNMLRFPTLLAVAACAFALPMPASAAPVDMEFGASIPSGTSASGAVAISDQVPFLPVSGAVGQITAFLPLLDGRYAATAEVRTPDTHGAYFGVGAGVGRLNQATGLVVDAIGGVPTGMPNVSVALRFYASTSRGVGTAGFAGLRIRL